MMPRNYLISFCRKRANQADGSILYHRSQKRTFMNYDHVVDNTGSIARDVLAAERTFLAWSRTGLGFVGAGSAMFAAYHRYNDAEDYDLNADKGHIRLPTEQIYPASALLVANGAFLLVFATRRYLQTVAALTKEKFPIDTRGTLMAVVATASSTLTSLGLVLQANVYKPKNPSTHQQAPKDDSQAT